MIHHCTLLVPFWVRWKHTGVPTFEYLTLTLTHETNWSKIKNISPLPVQKFTQTYHIRRPNGTEPEELAGGIPLAVVFNDLGREGWRLVTCEIPESTVASGGYRGWDEVGIPVRQRWTFIREAHS